ncbi:EAL domain-containing protein [Oxalobacter paraformigenes]|uniref:Diguanylate cyclase (GGDEF) domain-containing protein n=1 Tax=Oxalobacter paraformigenes TaxID=556268 RepID=C3X404_9BURK|nr:EAL domain-containing protein [Oxalobacter paraformigenes]EEO27940.1 diguanylate cyclase (GGDEF) domain-containing protein [Oxalobacter paraformigenes]
MEKRPRHFAAFFLALLFFFLTFPAQAADRPASRIVRVGFPQIAGFGYIDQDGSLGGYNYDYLQKLAQYTNWKYEFVTGTWEECYSRLKKGQIDMLGGMQRTPEREKWFDFSDLESFLNYNVLLVRPDDRRFLDKSPEELGTLSAGSLKGSYETVLFASYAKKQGIRYRLKTYNRSRDMVMALKNGDIDVLLNASSNKINGLRVLASFAPSPLFYAVRKGHKALLDELNAAQSALKSQDRFFDFRLYEKHYGFNETHFPTLTKQEREAIGKTPVLRVAWLNGWRPLSARGNSGVVADIFAFISANTGIKIDYVNVPSHEAAFRKMQDGDVDAIGMVETDSDAITRFGLQPTIPFIQVPIARVTPAGNPPPPSSPERVSFAHYSNEHFINDLKKRHPLIEIVRKDSPHQIFEALANGEIDAGYVNIYSANALMSWPEYSALSFNELATYTTEFAIVFSRDTDRNIVNAFNKYIRQLRNYKLHEFIITNMARQPKRNLFTLIRENPAWAFYGFAFILAMTIGFFTCILVIRNRAHKSITDLIVYDQLTGLPRLMRFAETATKRLNRESGNIRYGVVYININNFKYINDIHDFSKGDELLRAVANRLTAFIQTEQGETVCRESADRFILFLASASEQALKKRMVSLNAALSDFGQILGNYPVTFSCGVYLLQNRDTIDAAINYAHYAQISKNKASYNTFTWFDDAIVERIRENRKIEQLMDGALASGQFVPYFQPKVNMQTGEVVGAEALTRWLVPGSEPVPPDRFIPLFEKNNFIIRLDLYIFEKTCHILKSLMEEGKNVFPVSCNFSHNHFIDHSLPARLMDIARRYKVPFSLLDIEITETSVINDIDAVIWATRELRQAGFRISLDDFGVGYSSVNLLCQIQVDTLKLDKSFLDQASSLPCKRTLIEGIADIAGNLGIDILCEGVETALQVEFLKRTGCTLAQGYYYSKPVPFDEFAQLWLKNSEQDVVLT